MGLSHSGVARKGAETLQLMVLAQPYSGANFSSYQISVDKPETKLMTLLQPVIRSVWKDYPRTEPEAIAVDLRRYSALSSGYYMLENLLAMSADAMIRHFHSVGDNDSSVVFVNKTHTLREVCQSINGCMPGSNAVRYPCTILLAVKSRDDVILE